MHLLATTSGVVDGGAEAIDLKQTPGDIVVLSAADSELAALALASDRLPGDFPSIRLASLLQLQHNYSVDLYTEQTLAHAKLVIVRLLGGKSYWPYGVERLLELEIPVVFLPGGTETDPALTALSTVPQPDCEMLRQYLAHGGPENALNFWRYAHSLGRHPGESRDLPNGMKEVPAFAWMTPAKMFPKAGTFRRSDASHFRIGIVFYRALLEGGLVAPINALCDEFEKLGHSVSAIYIASLKDQTSAATITSEWQTFKPDVIVNATAFAIADARNDPLTQFDCPVLQVTLAGLSEDEWRKSSRGLGQKDLAMSVVLPELDGRIYTRAISFKADQGFHQRTQCRIVTHRPLPDRIRFVADQAIRWAALRHKPNDEKRIAIILANYPNKDGRIANGVGYDTPASTVNILGALLNDGYHIAGCPLGGNELIEALQSQRTNAASGKASSVQLALLEYENHFATLPAAIREAVAARWGKPSTDPFAQDKSFHLPLLHFGNAVVGIQPARGYNIDPKSTYHDPALVPPHGYFAFYFWLRHHFKADAIIHNGKHGNLEWLPGKAVGLSQECYPEALLGPTPHIYPFIVNDPGEGTAAKRRASAVIIDHLTPPLTRAESYGPLKDLEALVDEYYLASGLDPRRLKLLKEKILALTRHHHMDTDAGFTGDEDADLQRLDTFLCDLKEAQIRDGLHILGESPVGRQEADLLVALTRVPSGDRPSLIRAIADDLALYFDPLNCQFADEWKGPRPETLRNVSSDPWRTSGDTVERLELLAAQLVDTPPPPFGVLPHAAREGDEITSSREAWGSTAKPGGGVSTRSVLKFIDSNLRPTLASCGSFEITNLLRALNGKPVSPGPSGAPTRGRLDVLPTGRNFYSLDSRTLPTPAAWQLGKASADALLTRHFQDTGLHLQNIGLSVWGTANMRTGGDDLAQALWLMGVKPVWDTASWRTTGFEIQPLAAIGRPRVDVTLRISGFFRDAFPQQIELMDKAIRAVAALDEAAEDNPLAASLTTSRIFGSRPGAYGAGLQAMIDEGIWQTKHDLAAAYVTWGSYVYGTKDEGRADPEAFRDRLAKIEAVIHNQDNREHDLLDSDDYYQFEGGMSAAVETASGKKPRIYHNDHSRPERPVIRTLDEEIARVMRSRVVNPKWINGVKRHGYKGAFEIAATVDYMFAFAATADAVKSHHFDLAFDAYINDDDTRKFMADNNPHALREMAERFAEAISRGLWQPRRNDVHDRLRELQT